MPNAPAFDHAAYRPPAGFQTSGADYRFTLPTHPAWIGYVFLIQSMADSADGRYPPGGTDYGVAWLLHIFLGPFGIHRFYMGKMVTGVIYLCTGASFGIGYIY